MAWILSKKNKIIFKISEVKIEPKQNFKTHMHTHKHTHTHTHTHTHIYIYIYIYIHISWEGYIGKLSVKNLAELQY